MGREQAELPFTDVGLQPPIVFSMFHKTLGMSPSRYFSWELLQ
jgi:hypothetical protein